VALTDNLRPYSPQQFQQLGDLNRYLIRELANIAISIKSLRSVLQQLESDTYTVATLPAASSNKGARYMVSDATATTFWSVVVGGGANLVPVMSDGTSWRIG
jgi:hypothetical protein